MWLIRYILTFIGGEHTMSKRLTLEGVIVSVQV